MKKFFLDTNIFIYANDSRDTEKQQKAIDIIKSAFKSGNGVISIQVINEYANVAINKLKQDPGIVVRQIKLLENLEVILPSVTLTRRGIEILQAYKISFWDAQRKATTSGSPPHSAR